MLPPARGGLEKEEEEEGELRNMRRARKEKRGGIITEYAEDVEEMVDGCPPGADPPLAGWRWGWGMSGV